LNVFISKAVSQNKEILKRSLTLQEIEAANKQKQSNISTNSKHTNNSNTTNQLSMSVEQQEKKLEIQI
jgi:hypothetical protein